MEKNHSALVFRIPKIILKIIFFLLLLFFSPYAVDAADLELEKGIQKDLEQSRIVGEKIAEKLRLGKTPSAEMALLKSLSENIKASHLLMQERFKSREEKVKPLGSKAIDRQRAMSEGYSKALTEYLSLIEGLPSESSSQKSGVRSQQATIDKLKTLIDKIIPQKKRPIFGSLPYKHLNCPAKEPSTAPSITPAYRGGNQNSTSDDLKSTAEAPISNEIATLAQSLNWNPVSIYDYVKNNVETEWYWGCMKGAEETLHQKSGNDCDQAALLIALLRASNYPSRYVRGTIEFFPDIERAKNLIGIDDPQKIAEFFQKAGIPFKTVLDETTIKNIQIEHIWVESLIPYSNYRGAIMDDQGKTWLGLDTSIKAAGYTYNAPLDLLSEYSLSTMRDEYLSATQTQTPLEYIKTKIDDYLALNHPGKTYTDYLKTRTLNPEVMQILPGSMQFNQVKITNEYTQIPDELIHTIKFTATNPQLATGNELFAITLSAYKLSNQKIAITYEPETVEDQEIIDSYGGLDNTPSYLIRLRPVLKINDDRQVVGTDGLAMGADYDLNIELRVPGYESAIEKITSTMIVGNLSVIGISAQKTITLAVVSEEDKDAEQILYEEAIKYIDRWNKAEDELASLTRLAIARPSPTVLMVGGVIDVTSLLDTPQGYTWKGAFIDADLRTIETVASDESRVKNFMQLSSLQGSVLENRIFEDDFQVGSISTAKLFQLANTQPVTLLSIDQSNIATVLSTLPFDQNIKDDITDAVTNQNLTVRIPQSEIAYENWTGVGYIKENPATGESGWMLSGMIAGGMTAWGFDKWPDYYSATLSNPYSEPPNYDPGSATYIQKITTTDMQDAEVGTILKKTLTVKVTDQQMKPVKGASVIFTVKAGGGKLLDPALAGIEVETVSVKTDAQGLAKVAFKLGKQTKINPTFVTFTDADKYATQVSENIIAVSLGATGTTTPIPFTAYGLPGEPANIRQLHGNGITNAILSFSGFISVSIEDKYGNPISNLAVDFDARPAKPKGDCDRPSQDSRGAQIVHPDNPCVYNAPKWGECADAGNHITETTASTGAFVNVILGGVPDATYEITANSGMLHTTFNLTTYPFGNCSDGYIDPEVWLILESVDPSDAYGNNINAGKSGTSIPIMAKVYFLKEGKTTKDETLGCGLTCPKIIGDRTTTASNVDDAVVAFSGISGSPRGGGVYTIAYPLAPGINTVAIQAAASTDVFRNYNNCFSGCMSTEHTVSFPGNASQTKQVYGVDIVVNPAPVIVVDDNQYAVQDSVIKYTISPPEYQAFSAYVMIYKDGNVIATIPSETKGQGYATISQGFGFDINSLYEVQVILNYGTGVEIRGEKKKVNLYRVELVDSSDNPITTTQVGEDENFVSWKTLEVKYKITPTLADTEYDWEVAPGTATKSGHPYLGTPNPVDPVDDVTNRILKFKPMSTGSQIVGSTEKAKPLAFELIFKLNNQAVKTFKIEQDYKNAIREEYKVYSADYVGVTLDDLPKRTDFATQPSEQLNTKYLGACAYNAADVPHGSNLNMLGTKLDNVVDGMYSITSSYRNPYRNDTVSKSMNSRHVWADAFDLKDARGFASLQLETVWEKIKDLTEFGQVIVESQDPRVAIFAINYLTGLEEPYIDGSVTFWLDDSSEDPKIQYEILWTKQVGYKKIYISWKEENVNEPQYAVYTFKIADWTELVVNLHAQGYPLSVWGF